MKVHFKEYGWIRVSFGTWLRALWNCWIGHSWMYIRNCSCGSDNCFQCTGCGYKSHD